MIIDKKLNLAIFFVLLAVSAFAQDIKVGERYTEKVGGYSICLPISWQVIEIPGLKYHAFQGPILNNSFPNINFIDQQYSSSLKEYVDLNIVQLRQILDDFVLVSRTNFSTTSKLSGERLVFLDRQGSLKLKQLCYIFSKDNLKMIITCTVPVNGGEFYDDTFDESIRTFHW